MNYLFPVRSFRKFSEEHVFFTWTVFLLFVSLPTLMGYVPRYEKNFYSPSDHLVWRIYFSYMDIIHTRTMNIVFSLLTPILEIWFIFFLSGMKRSNDFKNFILPFISYAFIGIALRIIDMLPWFHVFSPPIGIIVTVYFLLFFIFTTINIYYLNLFKSIIIVVAAFISTRVLIFLLTGPAFGMILQELKI